MNVQFLPEARAELVDAVSYYEGEVSGLGLRLWRKLIVTSRGSSGTTTCHALGPAIIAE
jgi:hypothetical protein